MHKNNLKKNRKRMDWAGGGLERVMIRAAFDSEGLWEPWVIRKHFLPYNKILLSKQITMASI